MFRSLVLPFALLLSLVAVSYADVYTTASVPVQTADAPYDVGRSSYIHNALYFEAALGFRYLNLDDTYYDESSYSFEKDRVYETDFSGFGPEFYARLGGVFSSRIALFGFLGIASMKSETTNMSNTIETVFIMLKKTPKAVSASRMVLAWMCIL